MSTITTTMITSAPSTAARRRQYTTGFSGPTGWRNDDMRTG
ncbi:hypothetical protein [Curtobacterium sp. 24E2]